MVDLGIISFAIDCISLQKAIWCDLTPLPDIIYKRRKKITNQGAYTLVLEILKYWNKQQTCDVKFENERKASY